MSADWPTCLLGELLELVIDHRGKTPKKMGFDDFHSFGYPVLTAKHVKTDQLVNLKSIKYANKTMYKKWMKVEVQQGDIVLTSEAPLGQVYYLDGKCKYLLGQRVFGLRPDTRKINPLYLVAWLASAKGQSLLEARATGSTVSGIKQAELLKVEVEVPPVKVQERIAQIRYDFMRKTRLNTQINQTLEAIAQAIFKSWFVDFDPVRAKMAVLEQGGSAWDAELAAMGTIASKTPKELARLKQTDPDAYKKLADTAALFPSAMQESELGMIPEGWEVSTIGASYKVVMGQSPKGDTYNENNNGTLFYQGRAEFDWRFPNPRLYTTAPKRMAIKGDALISVRAPVGDLNIALENCCIGRGLSALRHCSGNMSFTYYQLKQLVHQFDTYNGEGTVFGSINQKNLKAINIINPSNSLLNEFIKLAEPCDLKIKSLSEENLSLANTRNTLLPKLLSGEIQLNTNTDPQEKKPMKVKTTDASLEERLQMTETPGVEVELTREEAEELGAFEETALTEEDAKASWEGVNPKTLEAE